MEKISKGLSKILSNLLMIMIVLLTVVVALQVITRILEISVPWAEELARFLLIWLTFIGTSVAIHEKMHLAVKFFVRLAPIKIQYYIGLFTYSIIIIFFGSLIFAGFNLAITTMNKLSSSLQWPMGLVYLVLPIASIFAVIFTINEAKLYIKKKGEISL